MQNIVDFYKKVWYHILACEMGFGYNSVLTQL